MAPLISAEKRQDILQAGEAVYTGYVLLDMCTNTYYANHKRSFRINNGKDSFKDFVVEQINNAGQQHEIRENFTLNGNEYALIVTKQAGDWVVHVDGDTGLDNVSIKAVNEYSPEEFIELVQKNGLILSQDDQTDDYKFSTSIAIPNKTPVTIGGLGKIDLYQLHINNLYAMLKNLSTETPNQHMLIAMATGSGKSYTQALWFLIMHLADCSCAFAVSREDLVRQLDSDFRKLLPNDITADLGQTVRTNKPFYAITTHKKLLMDFWKKLYTGDNDSSRPIFLSFDEEHEASKIELYKERIKLLTQQSLRAMEGQRPWRVVPDRPRFTESARRDV